METIKIENCEGYLWWSDQEEPEIYDGKVIDICLDEKKNPFVIEGQLYDKDEKKSYSIKYVDGQYIVIEYQVEKDVIEALSKEKEYKSSDESVVVEPKHYLSNRMGDRWLKFLRYWEEKRDKNCMDMPVLTFTKNIFVGFKEKEDLL